MLQRRVVGVGAEDLADGTGRRVVGGRNVAAGGVEVLPPVDGRAFGEQPAAAVLGDGVGAVE
ncbi:MAG TPA: hypothetical protein VLR26_11225, partial [Frankiaceae bacterium]|nr:hypothetical protein [Frankiaceae bacterium]